MNKENVARWVDELIFGDYQQARGQLHNRTIRPIGGDFLRVTEVIEIESHCAFGVADLLIPGDFRFETAEIIEWLGLEREQAREIINLNDELKMTLPQIGMWVRDTWLKEE